MSFIFSALGTQAFSKWRVDGGALKKMSNFNAAVFDAVAVGLAKAYPIEELKADASRIEKKLNEFRNTLFAESLFFDAVSGSVNDSAKVAARIERFYEYVRQ